MQTIHSVTPPPWGVVFSKDFGICDSDSAISWSRQDRNGQQGINQFG